MAKEDDREDGGDAAAEARAEAWADFAGGISELVQKHVGRAQLQALYECPCAMSRKRWYVRLIKDLMWQKGRIDQRLARFRSTESPEYRRQDALAKELETVADHLAMGLVAVRE